MGAWGYAHPVTMPGGAKHGSIYSHASGCLFTNLYSKTTIIGAFSSVLLGSAALFVAYRDALLSSQVTADGLCQQGAVGQGEGSRHVSIGTACPANPTSANILF